jgi:hypothetical protein
MSRSSEHMLKSMSGGASAEADASLISPVENGRLTHMAMTPRR